MLDSVCSLHGEGRAVEATTAKATAAASGSFNLLHLLLCNIWSSTDLSHNNQDFDSNTQKVATYSKLHPKDFNQTFASDAFSSFIIQEEEGQQYQYPHQTWNLA